MNRISIVVVAVAVAVVAATANGQILAKRKPGLWEMEYAGQGGGARQAAQQAEMQQRLSRMTPEQRAQMEAAMEKSGTGMKLGPNGVPVMVMRFCLTPQQIAEESARGFMKGMGERSGCDARVLAQSASEVRVHSACRSARGASEVDARIYDMAPDRYKVDMKVNGREGDVNVHQDVHWLGSDCKGVI
jgi:hypothetical protein